MASLDFLVSVVMAFGPILLSLRRLLSFYYKFFKPGKA